MQDEDKTYENEFNLSIQDDRGSLDLTRQIDELNKKRYGFSKRKSSNEYYGKR